jgi:hypothetical protein
MDMEGKNGTGSGPICPCRPAVQPANQLLPAARIPCFVQTILNQPLAKMRIFGVTVGNAG